MKYSYPKNLLPKDNPAYSDSLDKEEIFRAYEFAKKAHQGQLRKSGEPYISHPMAVAKILIELESDQPTIIAAILHDVVEDTDYTLEDIQGTFGSQVARLVDGVTKISQASVAVSRKNLSIQTLKKVFWSMEKDLRVLTIKIADRLHNMRTIQHLSSERRYAIADQTFRVYVPLSNLLGVREIHDELEDICISIIYEDLYKFAEKKLFPKTKSYQKSQENFIKTLEEKAKKKNTSLKVIKRKKSVYNVLKANQFDITKLENLKPWFSVELITQSTTDCYVLLGVVHENFKPLIGRFFDRISFPKNNYRYLKTSVLDDHGTLCDVYIQTQQMQQQHYFSITHKINKDTAKLDWLQEIKETLETSPHNKNFVEHLNLENLQNNIVTFSASGESHHTS